MENLLNLVKHNVDKAIRDSLSKEVVEDALLQAEIEQTSNPTFGHYQCNNAFKLGKVLRKNPRQIAQSIIDHLSKSSLNGDLMISSVEIAGPGFINISLDPGFLAKQIESLLIDPRLGVPVVTHPKKVIVEFSSPNVAKELHVGHLRSTIIGDCLARLFEFLGDNVLRLNHIGDWGTQFGMLIAYMQEYASDVLEGKKEVDLSQLMQWYKESKKKFDEDPVFKRKSQLEVVKLQGGDSSSLLAWQMICDISRKAFLEIYDLLDIKTTERGESFYNPYLPVIVADLEKKGLITISDGAKCIFLEGFTNRENEPLPIIIQKSDGGYNYDTTDMAAIWHRVEKEKADRIIYCTDAGQSLHFQMLFVAAEKAGYVNSKKVQLDHVTFGVVLGPDGKKFKTRSGETERLIDLLLEAIAQAKKIMHERLPDISMEELDSLSKILGINALKYADLSGHRVKDYSFSYERMLKFEGNTAAFLLYAYVRIQGIKRKVSKDVEALIGKESIILEHPSEVELALHLRQFGETLEGISKDLLPNRLSEYLYTLAEKFHAFFRDCRVEGSERESSRLLLAEAAARILKKGLEILGLQVMNKM